jgi:hypothetical protein
MRVARAFGSLALLAAACGGPDAPPVTDASSSALDARALEDAAVGADAAAPVSSCEGAVCSGAVDPVSLGPGIDPVVGTRAETGSPGAHWFCRPSELSAWNGKLVIHIVGTWSDPVADHRFPEHACGRGFAAIAPMYENRAPARETCGEDGPCYEAHRREIVDGEEGAPPPVDVDAASSLRNRIATLLDHLAERDGAPWPDIRDRLAADDWTQVALSGHSQGSGHALYLGREEAAERVVLLAGPSDRLGDRTPTSTAVPWIAALETSPPRTRLVLGFIHDDDTIQVVSQVTDNWRSIGVPDVTCTHDSAGGYAPSCRRVHIPTDACTGLAAHSTVVVRQWGPACALGAAGRSNAATWDFLLDAR